MSALNARTLRALRLAPTIFLATSITISDDQSGDAARTPLARKVVNPQLAAAAAQTVGPIPQAAVALNFQQVVRLPAARGDFPLMAREPLITVDVPVFRFVLSDFEAFAAQRNIFYEGINVGKLVDEINKLVNML